MLLPIVSWISSAVSFAAPVIPTHQDAVRLCIVQPPEVYYGFPVNGDDARRLAWELSRRKLSSGNLLLTITLVGYSGKAVTTEVQNQLCVYVAEVRHHRSADAHVTASIPGAPSPTDRIPPMHDQDAILIEMKQTATRKVVLRVSAMPLTHYGRSNVVFTPFPLFAQRILAKLNTLPHE